MNKRTGVATAVLAIALLATTSAYAVAQPEPAYDLVIKGGTIYDGSGGVPYVGDVAIKGDKIVYVGATAPATATKYVDAKGLAVSPGFINMLSWATESLLVDGRGQSDLRQGVTTEVMGEGWSMGPVNDEMKKLADTAAGRCQISDRMDDTRRIPRVRGAKGAPRSMSLLSSARRQSASTSLENATSIPTRPNSTGCAVWCARR